MNNEMPTGPREDTIRRTIAKLREGWTPDLPKRAPVNPWRDPPATLSIGPFGVVWL